MLRAAAFLTLALAAALPSCTAADAPSPPDSAARTITLRYAIEGMHCAGCVEAITDKVTQIAGVTKCDVSLDENKAEIQVTREDLAPAIEEAITKLGYKVTKTA